MKVAQNLSVEFYNEYDQLIKAGYQYIEGTPKPQPISRPQFTLTQLKQAVPPHCFQRSTIKSFGYLTLDFVIVVSLFSGAYFILEQWHLPIHFKIAGYCLYWFLQGSILFGVWVLGHECGHSAFSESDLVNNVVGFICHSILLVPYFSFKFTHRIHHTNTGSCENDIGFVPCTRKQVEPTWSESLEDSPLYQLFRIVRLLLVGMQLFLLLNVSGPRKYENGPKSHFNPNSAFFTPKQRSKIVLSDIGIGLILCTTVYFISNYGLLVVLRLYIVPYLIMNAYLVTITYLQHTDTYVPHFRESEWSWIRGALCTVDRSYGKFLDTVFHHLTDTHICHHIFPKMPFYHCVEATEAIKPILGKYYLKDDTPVTEAMWRIINYCKYVPDDGNVVFYKKELFK